MKSVLQDWVMELGLRHQGVLLTAVRGCDTVPKEDPSKALVRAYRAAILIPHCGDVKKSASFIEHVDSEELLRRINRIVKSHDHYPHHYLMHLIHAAEIVGYYGPNAYPTYSGMWYGFYLAMCNKFHMTVEMKGELEHRLDANEETFKRMQE